MGSFTGKIAAGGTESFQFDLIQFHFHYESDHRVNCQQYDFVMHMVHLISDTALERSYAVIGILFKKGIENDFLQDLIENGDVDWTEIWDEAKLDEWLYYE